MSPAIVGCNPEAEADNIEVGDEEAALPPMVADDDDAVVADADDDDDDADNNIGEGDEGDEDNGERGAAATDGLPAAGTAAEKNHNLLRSKTKYCSLHTHIHK